ncbi:MAG TPA: hypothetical protein VGS11_05375 [Candidatus Bathyarchaeia archaeon]|nr:hypothetical protein [Candidatus Bathyarchaeia archaeon]
MRREYLAIAILTIGLIGIVGIVWYQSIPRPNGVSTTYSTEYLLTKNGNHTQMQASYSNGAVTTEQLNWLNFDNKTAVYNYFRCTPSMPGCTVEGCPFTVLTNTVSEYRVKIVCKPGD